MRLLNSSTIKESSLAKITVICSENGRKACASGYKRLKVHPAFVYSCHFFGRLHKAWFPYSRYRSLGVVDSLSQSLEYLGRWESLPVVGSLSGSLAVAKGICFVSIRHKLNDRVVGGLSWSFPVVDCL